MTHRFVSLIFCAMIGGMAIAADLSDVAFIERFDGSAEARQILAREGFVCTGDQIRQMFLVYCEKGNHPPRLITTDCMLDAYNRLFASAVISLECRQAGLLTQFSRRLYEIMIERDDAISRDLARLAAAGLVIQDRWAIKRLRAEHVANVQAILKAIDDGTGEQRFLGLQTPISVEDFHPIGFYTRTPQLSAYFQARRWYANCTFRFDSNREVRRAMTLAAAITEDETLAKLYRPLTVPYDQLLGRPDDVDEKVLAALMKSTGTTINGPLDALRDALGKLDRSELPAINDHRATVFETPAERLSFRVFPARRTPCALLFDRTTHPNIRGRYFPSGVDLFAAGRLASDAGRRALREQITNNETYEAVIGVEPVKLTDTLYDETLDMLAMLQQPVNARAPDVFRRAAWGDKQLGTQLGAWADLRHTWALQTKLMRKYAGIAEIPPAYVSPYPEFFRRLAAVGDRTAKLLAAYDLPDPAEHDSTLHGTYEVIEEFDDLEEEQLDFISGDELLVHFALFSKTARRLADIAQRQLADEKIGSDDRKWLEGFGETLSRLNLYRSVTYWPRDDHPRVVPIYSVTMPELGTLHVGLARPETVMAILPIGDRRVLHVGAIYSYRETIRPPGPPLTDERWRTMIDTDRFPDPPRFTRSYRSRTTIDDVIEGTKRGRAYKQFSAYENSDDPRLTDALYEGIVALLKLPNENRSTRKRFFDRYLSRVQQDDVPRVMSLFDHRLEDKEVVAIAGALFGLKYDSYIEGFHVRALNDLTDRGCNARLLLTNVRRLDFARVLAAYDSLSLVLRADFCKHASAALWHFIVQNQAKIDSNEIGSPPSEKYLLHAMKDRSPLVRYEAALEFSEHLQRCYNSQTWWIKGSNPRKQIEERILTGIDDPNQEIGGLMAQIAVDLNIEGASTKIIARLKEWSPACDTSPYMKIEMDDSYTWQKVMLARRDPSRWIEALKDLRCAGARDALLDFCRTSSAERDDISKRWDLTQLDAAFLLRAILEIDEPRNDRPFSAVNVHDAACRDRLFEIATDRTLRPSIRVEAISRLDSRSSSVWVDSQDTFDPFGGSELKRREPSIYGYEQIKQMYDLGDSELDDAAAGDVELGHTVAGRAIYVTAMMLRDVAWNGLIESTEWGEFPLADDLAALRLRMIARTEPLLSGRHGASVLEILLKIQAPSITAARLRQIVEDPETDDPLLGRSMNCLIGRDGNFEYERARFRAEPDWFGGQFAYVVSIRDPQEYEKKRSRMKIIVDIVETYLRTDPEEFGLNRERFEQVRDEVYRKALEAFDGPAAIELAPIVARAFPDRYLEILERVIADPQSPPELRLAMVLNMRRHAESTVNAIRRYKLYLQVIDDRTEIGRASCRERV